MFHEKERKIKSILKEESNNKCIDCNNPKPEYISLNNACFICKNCFKKHQKFPFNISKPIKNNLTSLTLKELQYLYFGGNNKLLEFMKYEYPKLINLNRSFAYKTIAMDYYRKWLKFLIEGGDRPYKPDIEIAYKSIDDKEYNSKKYLNRQNEIDVITIDFYNDCYNYNDKNNNSITNFINKNNIKSNIFNNNNENKLKYKKTIDKDINEENYNKYINTQTIDLFSHTQSNFMPKSNNFNNNYIVDKRINRRDKSSENIFIDNNKKYEYQNNNLKIYKNEDYKTFNNDKGIKAFKTNNKVYIKPTHNALKSFEKNAIIIKKMKDLKEKINLNKEKEEKKENNIEVIEIKVKRGKKNIDKKEKKEENSNINYKDNFNNNIIIHEKRNSEVLCRISKGDINKKFNKKNKIYSLNELNLLSEIKKDNLENNIYIKDNVKTENINITNNTKDNSAINNNNNNIIFKKKNLKNSFFTNHEKRIKRNLSKIEHSQFEIISKNKMNTSNNEKDNLEESNDDSMSLGTTRTLTLTKSMKQFYSRYPRKMNKTKSKARNLNSLSRNKEERKKIKLKKEKSEIIQSLKILMKKKDELINTKKEENKGNKNNIKKDNDNKKVKKNNNIKKASDIKNKINNKENKNKNKIKRDNNSDNEDEKIENKENKIKKDKKSKKLYSNIKKEFLKKSEEKDSTREKYKKKNYKYSEI